MLIRQKGGFSCSNQINIYLFIHNHSNSVHDKHILINLLYIHFYQITIDYTNTYA